MTERSGLAFKRKSFFEIKNNDRISRKLQQEIPQGSDRKLVSDKLHFFDRQSRMPSLDLAERMLFKPGDEIVGLYAEAFPSAHFDKRPLFIFVRNVKTEFFSRRR